MSDKRYPMEMRHPNYRKGTTKVVPGQDPNTPSHKLDYQGTPDVFPPVTVYNEDQENEHRSKGYISAAEALPMTAYQEFPVWLTHAKKEAKMANNQDEETELIEQGYKRPGKSDPEAVQKAVSSPHVPGQNILEFPKMVRGKVVDPAAEEAEKPDEYPKWVQGRIVNSRAEERALLGITPAAGDKPSGNDDKKPENDDSNADNGDAASKAEREALFAECKQKGIKTHWKFSTEKLKELLANQVAA